MPLIKNRASPFININLYGLIKTIDRRSGQDP